MFFPCNKIILLNHGFLFVSSRVHWSLWLLYPHSMISSLIEDHMWMGIYLLICFCGIISVLAADITVAPLKDKKNKIYWDGNTNESYWNTFLSFDASLDSCICFVQTMFVSGIKIKGAFDFIFVFYSFFMIHEMK